MTSAFNSRIIRVGIQIGGDVEVFENLDIRCRGQKMASSESSICTMKISNLTRTQKNYIMTKASPLAVANNSVLFGPALPREPIIVTVDVGRKDSFSPFRLFFGSCWASTVTMPPDIGIVLTSTTNNLQASTLQPISLGATTDLKQIAQTIASLYGLQLNFTATQKNVANFHYTGGMQQALDKLALCGNIRVQLDGKIMSVYDVGQTVGPFLPFKLNITTGMVGIPEVTESGVKARMLIRPEPQIGGSIIINSQVNPSVNNSVLTISTMNFDLASRDDPFWYELFCSNINQVQPGQ